MTKEQEKVKTNGWEWICQTSAVAILPTMKAIEKENESEEEVGWRKK